MNNHISSVFHRKKSGSLALVAIGLLVFTTISNSFAQETDSISLSTNKNSYLPGDNVQLSGVVTGQTNVLVALEVTDSDGTVTLNRTVQADQNGNFAIQFKIPNTATSGAFSVYASALVNGFHIKQTKVFSATVSEFGQVTGAILGFSTMLIILVFTKSSRLQKMTHQHNLRY